MNSMGNAEATYNGAHSYHQANFNGYPSANPNAYVSRGNPFDWESVTSELIGSILMETEWDITVTIWLTKAWMLQYSFKTIL